MEVPLSDSGESAADQLLAEAEAPRLLDNLNEVAERGANLLNAARATNRPEQVPKSNGKPRMGKLKRPSMGAKGPRPTARRGDIYDIPVSPQKPKANKEPIQAPPKPLEVVIVGKKKGPRTNGEAPKASLSVPDTEAGGSALSNPSNNRKSGRLAGKKADISDVEWEKRPETRMISEKHTNSATENGKSKIAKPAPVPQKSTGGSAQTRAKSVKSKLANPKAEAKNGSRETAKSKAKDAKSKPTKSGGEDEPRKEGKKSSGTQDKPAKIAKRRAVDVIAPSERRSKTPRTDNGHEATGGATHSASPEENRVSQSSPHHPRVVIPIRTPPKEGQKTVAFVEQPELVQQSPKAQARQEDESVKESSNPAPRKKDRAKAKTKKIKPVSSQEHHTTGKERRTEEELPTTAGHQEDLPAPPDSAEPNKGSQSTMNVSASESASKQRKSWYLGKAKKKTNVTTITEESSPAPIETVSVVEEDGPAVVHTEEILLTSEIVIPDSARRDNDQQGSEASDDDPIFVDDGVHDSEEEEEDFEEGLFDPDAEPLETISRFIDSCGQEGSCQTELGKDIKRLCRRGSRALGDSAVGPTEVDKLCVRVGDLLHTVIHQKKPKEKIAFKKDASAYLFHSMATFLEAVYSWAQDHYSDPLSSLSFLEIIVPLLERYIWFAEFIWEWGGKAINLDDNVVRNTKWMERGFLDPLRLVEEQHRLQKARLEQVAEREKRDIELREEEEAEQRRAAIAKKLRDRMELWQRLHSCRLQCETSMDPRRRRHLFIQPLENFDEVDANGVRFERENVFHERETPFMHRRAHDNNDDWTDQHSYDLAEGLREYAGMIALFYSCVTFR